MSLPSLSLTFSSFAPRVFVSPFSNNLYLLVHRPTYFFTDVLQLSLRLSRLLNLTYFQTVFLQYLLDVHRCLPTLFFICSLKPISAVDNFPTLKTEMRVAKACWTGNFPVQVDLTWMEITNSNRFSLSIMRRRGKRIRFMIVKRYVLMIFVFTRYWRQLPRMEPIFFSRTTRTSVVVVLYDLP